MVSEPGANLHHRDVLQHFPLDADHGCQWGAGGQPQAGPGGGGLHLLLHHRVPREAGWQPRQGPVPQGSVVTKTQILPSTKY